MSAEVVEFKKRLPPYNVGERAVFPSEQAQSLIEKGIATRSRVPRSAARETAPPVIPKGARVGFFVPDQGDAIGEVTATSKDGLTIASGGAIFEGVDPGSVRVIDAAPIVPASIGPATADQSPPA